MADPSITDEEIIRRLFVSALARPPEARELSVALQNARGRREVFEDVLWAIFNSKEFLYNH